MHLSLLSKKQKYKIINTLSVPPACITFAANWWTFSNWEKALIWESGVIPELYPQL